MASVRSIGRVAVAVFVMGVGHRVHGGEGFGACCFSDGSCEFTTSFDCEKAGGSFQGIGTTCDSKPCLGACCLGGGSCFLASPDSCLSKRGEFNGFGTGCEICSPPGACCLSDGSCFDVDEYLCDVELGGVFAGQGTFCETGVCHGACCFPDGTCEELDGGTCDELGGEFTDFGITCDEASCAPPSGACCLDDGSCIFVSEDECLAGTGTYQGDFTTCEDASCPPAEGACCLADGLCVDAGESECSQLGGAFAGAGTDCRTTTCPQPGEINFEGPAEFVAAGEPRREATGNLGGSSRDDVVLVLPGDDPSMPGAVQVFLNLAGASSGAWPGLDAGDPIPTGRDPSDVAVGFFNDDAFADLAVTNEGDGTLMIYLNDGSGQGTFLPPTIMAVGVRPTSVAAAPFDTRPGVDLVVALGGENRVVLLSNNGSGEYMQTASSRTGQDPGTVEPEDVDDDKDFDVVVANKGDGTATIISVEGDGFASSVTLPVGPEPDDLATGDVDGNGFADVITADRGTGAGAGGGSVSLLLNFGGTFIPAIQVPVGDMPRSVDLGDFDGDGDLDLAVAAGANGSSMTIQVLANTAVASGGNPFGAPMGFGVGGVSVELSVLRLDDDGRHDIVSANVDTGPTGGSVSALINSTLPGIVDCNDNDQPDDCDIATGVSQDCNGNGIPDECDTAIPLDPALTEPEDICALADPICPGIVYAGDTTGATTDGGIFCGLDIGVFDVWYEYTAAWDGLAFAALAGPGLDSVLTIYDGCPNLGGQPIACNDLNPNGVVFDVARGGTYYVRVAGGDFDTGPFTLSLVGPDCVLNLLDFDADGIPDSCQCPYDLNGDGIVDDFDVVLGLAQLGQPCKGCSGDVDGSGVVNASDIQLILVNRGPCPEGPDAPPTAPTGCID